MDPFLPISLHAAEVRSNGSRLLHAVLMQHLELPDTLVISNTHPAVPEVRVSLISAIPAAPLNPWALSSLMAPRTSLLADFA